MLGCLDRMGLPLEGSEGGQLRGLGQLTAMYGRACVFGALSQVVARYRNGVRKPLT